VALSFNCLVGFIQVFVILRSTYYVLIPIYW